jgi:segregation and condensation protein A
MESGIRNDSTFRIELPAFEGPLDLLLHLIKKHELDILDLPIAFVAERYLHYLSLMQQLDLNVASEYLLMAATLAHIKSKIMLPTPPTDQGDEEEDSLEDPRADLIRRLLEYQKYKEAAEKLGGRAIAGRDVFGRGAPSLKAEATAPLADVGLFRLLDAFEQILKRIDDRQAFDLSIERTSVRERVRELTDRLRELRSCRFDELFGEKHTRYDLVVTFLAILEMTKMSITRVYQADFQSPIYIQYALLEADEPSIPPRPPEPSIDDQPTFRSPESSASETEDEQAQNELELERPSEISDFEPAQNGSISESDPIPVDGLSDEQTTQVDHHQVLEQFDEQPRDESADPQQISQTTIEPTSSNTEIDYKND